MAFQLQLMRYVGEDNRIVKNSKISNTWTIQGTLKAETSVINPVIQIEKATAPMDTGYNYMYIPKFKRYYFIDDIISTRNSLWEIHARVDVLFTYAEDILNSKCIIDKTADESKANIYINDGSFVMDSHKFNQVKQFPYGLSDNGYNILICAGGV